MKQTKEQFMPQPTEQRRIAGPAGDIVVYLQGDASAPAVLMTHSILSSSMMWAAQADLLAACGWRVIRADTRGHGSSAAGPAPYSMADLVADNIAVLDGLQIARAHYVGLSLGGMSGFGMGIEHADRLLSLLLCDCRADMPADAAASWDERISMARAQGCGALALTTTERWFGKPFLDAHPETAKTFQETVGRTQVDGFAGSANAIQRLDYLPRVGRISTPVTLLAGGNDGVLPQVMQGLQRLLPGAKLELIANAGHLPNIDQPIAFNAAMMRHFFQNPSWSRR
jgi:3-oxoadipate enol-lactonase